MSIVYWGIVTALVLMVADLIFCLSLVSSGPDRPSQASGRTDNGSTERGLRKPVISPKAA